MMASKPATSLLTFTPPCLATPKAMPPNGNNWVHEIKFDGYRVQALLDNSGARLLTRNGLDWTERFGPVVLDLAKLGAINFAIDCEAVVFDKSGVSNFSGLQRELKSSRPANIVLMAFDLLHLEGASTSHLPLLVRKARLESLIKPLQKGKSLLRYSEHMTGDGLKLLERACSMQLEGIVSKRKDLPYRSGRQGDWNKTKCVSADPFVVIGFVTSKATPGLVGSLILGFYDAGALFYAGRVGTGFSRAEARAMAEGLAAIERKTPPLKQPLTAQQSSGVRWVEPELVAQISYRDVTADSVLRHATFEHFRSDKRPVEIERPRLFLPKS